MKEHQERSPKVAVQERNSGLSWSSRVSNKVQNQMQLEKNQWSMEESSSELKSLDLGTVNKEDAYMDDKGI